MKASQVVNLIKSWEGKNEADGSFKEIIDIYNTQKPLPRGYKVKYTDEWCATTVSAVAVKLGCTDIMPTECSCQKMIDKFKAINCWQENENVIPKAGWIIFYDWQDNGVGDNTGWSDHVGIVIEVKGNQITVIEGNLNNKVGRRALNVNAKYIRGYAMPKYEIELVATVKPTTSTTTSTSSTTTSVYYPKYIGNSVSLDAILKAVGVPAQYTGSYTNRKPLAVANGISNYSGTSAQNSTLKKLAKNGQLKKIGTTATTTQSTTNTATSSVKYFKKYTGTSGSIVTALNSIGVQSSYTYRAKIAKVNGISLYVGTAKQNTIMVNLLKQGKLIMP